MKIHSNCPEGAGTGLRSTLLAATALALALAGATACAAKPDGDGSHDDLVALFDEFVDWRDPPVLTDTRVVGAGPGALPVYDSEYVAERREALAAMQARLHDMGVDGWDRPQQADWLTVRALMDEVDFILHVTRPWARDPNFYVDHLLRIAFTELPVSGEESDALQARLREIPPFLEQARANLTDVPGDYADIALFNLTTEDGVNAGHPRRPVPPPGLIGWYEDLLGRAQSEQSALTDDVRAALDAIRGYRDWLEANRDAMTAEAGVGRERLDWFLQHVKMLPYTADEIAVLARREMERQRAFLALERHRNRDLPELTLPASEEEYLQRLADTDAMIRDWLVADEIITIPDFVPTDWQEMGFNVPWVEREGPPNFWEQIQYRDPSPDHLHAVIPGHRFDGWVERYNERPVRGRISFGDRREGWALYLEDAALQLGLFDDNDRPRTRELTYIMGLWRAARTLGDVWLQTNEKSAQDTIDWWVEVTPYMDKGVARRYAYLRPSPAHGLHYTMGSLQMYRLLADRYMQLGDDFVLQDFHDEFMSRGRVPISLVRWDMTGLDDDADMLWNHTPLSELLD